MKKLAIALAASSLTLGGCNFSDIASAGSLAVSAIPLLTSARQQILPAAGSMSREDYTETNDLYISYGKRIGAAVRSGAVSPPSAADEPDTIRTAADFCKLAVADLAQVSSPGGNLKRLDCLAVAAIDDMEDALGGADPVRYAAAKGRAKQHLSDMDKILTTAEGATP